MEDIKVSIIVPAYNVEKHIEKTLNSVINQTFKSFELIIVNDGSTDNTYTIINEMLFNSDINYNIINKVNEGVSIARNEGIRSANGDYIFFLDGDDFIKEECVEKLYNALINNNCDAAYTNYVKIKADGRELDNIPKINLPEKSSSRYLIKLEAKMAITFSFCQMMYKKSILFDNNLFFNPEMEYGEDTEFALRALAHIDEIVYVPENLIFYVHRENSATKKALFKRYNFIDALDKIIEYYISNNMPEDILKLMETYRIPKSIWGNTIYLFDADMPYKVVINELKRRKLIERLNSFEPVSKEDYIFLTKIKIFTSSPKLYYSFRNFIKKILSIEKNTPLNTKNQ